MVFWDNVVDLDEVVFEMFLDVVQIDGCFDLVMGMFYLLWLDVELMCGQCLGLCELFVILCDIDVVGVCLCMWVCVFGDVFSVIELQFDGFGMIKFVLRLELCLLC